MWCAYIIKDIVLRIDEVDTNLISRCGKAERNQLATQMNHINIVVNKWNELEAEVVDAISVNNFKRKNDRASEC